MGTGAAVAQNANEPMETVVVTGFRQSLEKALDMKRTALDSSDSILAEDIAKFPDMNVSESLQRIPGVALARDSGEGREITVRGLSAQFTRVRINGMEVLSTVGGEDLNTSGGNSGVNRGRAFDFNVFASELFTALTVHKSASADVEEGSLGATVDMHTAHPFDHPGFTFTAAGQYGYHQLSSSSNPRVAALISDTFDNGHLGVLLSGAYAITNTLEVGTSDIRTQDDMGSGTASSSTNQFASVCTGAGTGCTTSGTDFTTSNAAFKPRAPRYDLMTIHEKRLGLTGSVQWQPDDDTLFTLDGMYADFAQVRNEEYYEAYEISVANAATATKYPRSGTNASDPSLNPSHIYCYFAGETCAATPDYTQVTYGVHANNLINYSANNLNTVNITDPNFVTTSNPNGTVGVNFLRRAELTNVGLRSAHRLDHLDTRFMQLTLDGTHSFSEAFKVHVFAGWSESHHRNPIQTTLAADYGCVNTGTNANVGTCSATNGTGSNTDPYIYDYSNGYTVPELHYSASTLGGATFDNLSPSNAGWALTQFQMRSTANYNSFRTVTADFEYSPLEAIKIEGGVDYRNYGYGTVYEQRSMGGATTLDAQMPEIISQYSLMNYYQDVSMRGIKLPAGSTASYWIPDVEKFASHFDIWNQNSSNAGNVKYTNDYALGNCVSSTVPNTSASNCGAYHQGIEPVLSQNGQVREDDYGGWLQVNWDTQFYGVPFRGNIGGRYILTEQAATGYVIVSTPQTITGTSTLNGWSTVTISPNTAYQTYHDFLPSMNMVFETADNFLVRLNASYAMSRPGLTSLLPYSNVSCASSNNCSYTLGNAKLEPSRSKNIDLAFEWYYHKGAMLSIAGFYKHLDSIVTNVTYQFNFADHSNLTYGVPDSLAPMFMAACGITGSTWSNTQLCASGQAQSFKWSKSVNGKGAPLFGTEINWQQPLDFLPHPLDNFGILANLTLVQAQQTYYGNYMPVPGATLRTSYTGDLINLSRTSYNGTFYYDDTVFQARMTASFRSHFMIDQTVNSNNVAAYSASTFNLDMSASYKWSDELMLTFDALNLTGQPMNVYNDPTFKRPYIYHQTGRVLYAGVKYTY